MEVHGGPWAASTLWGDATRREAARALIVNKDSVRRDEVVVRSINLEVENCEASVTPLDRSYRLRTAPELGELVTNL